MRRAILVISGILSVFSLFSQAPSTVFEIENILVDACGGTVEGENEMVRFHIGPYSLNTANLGISGASSSGVITANKWPNTGNSWLGLTQNSTTATKTAQINSTITGCGLFKEPTGGILPAGSKVLLVTSTAFNPTVTDFSGLNDTIYIIFQSPGNTAGHFVNYTAGNTTRTLVLRFSGPHPYADTVVYHPNLLVTQAGIAGAQDGASVLYTWSGIPSYYNNGCTAPVNPLISISVTPTLPVCQGTAITFSSTVINGFPNPVYQWLVNGVLSGTNSRTFTTTNLNNNDAVSCRLISGTGCNSHDTAFSNAITVNLNPLPLIAISPSAPSAICAGSSVSLTASGATTYAWSPSTGLSSVTGSNITAAPSVTTTYTVSGTLSGCSNTARVIVTVNPLPVVSISPSSPAPVCPGASIALTSNGAISYVWSPAAGLNITSGTTVTATPNTTVTYTVTGTTSGCSATARVVVNVNPLLSVNITPSTPAPVCPGSNITLTASGASAYLWSPAGGLNTASGAIVTASPAVSTTYTVTGTSSGCTGTASVILTVNPVPVVNINPPSPAPVCAGRSVILTANGALTYTWAPTTGLNTATGTTVTASPAVSTTYTVTGTASGCSSTARVVVSINPITNVTVTSVPYPAITCAGGSVSIAAAGADTYSWAPSSGLNAVSGSTVAASPAGNIHYTVTGTDVNGCTDTASIAVIINTPVIRINPAQTDICEGSLVVFTASGGETYSWSPSGGLNSTAGTSVSASPVFSTTYTITGTNSGGCSDTAMAVITVHPLPVITVDPSNPAPVCSGDTIELHANGAITYIWPPDISLINADGSVVIAHPDSTTLCSVTGTDVNGCTGIASVLISIDSFFNVSVSPVDTSVCEGESVVLAASGTTSYIWAPANGLNSTTSSVIIASPAYSTTYSLAGTIGGCSKKAIVTVTVYPLPEAAMNIRPEMTSLNNPQQYFEDRSAGSPVDWLWDLGNGDISGFQSFYYSYSDTGTYTVQLIVYNEFGCSDTAYGSASVLPDFTVYIPNAFTPNSDGVNNIFYVYGTGIFDTRVRIFDRWGIQVFESQNIHQGWDGKFNGKIMPQDIYTCIVSYRDVFDKQYFKYGHVTLIR